MTAPDDPDGAALSFSCTSDSPVRAVWGAIERLIHARPDEEAAPTENETATPGADAVPVGAEHELGATDDMILLKVADVGEGFHPLERVVSFLDSDGRTRQTFVNASALAPWRQLEELGAVYLEVRSVARKVVTDASTVAPASAAPDDVIDHRLVELPVDTADGQRRVWVAPANLTSKTVYARFVASFPHLRTN